MSLPTTQTDGYVLHPDEGEAHDFLAGGRLVIKATAGQTGGKFAAVEFWGPRGFGSPIHVTATTTNSSWCWKASFAFGSAMRRSTWARGPSCTALAESHTASR